MYSVLMATIHPTKDHNESNLNGGIAAKFILAGLLTATDAPYVSKLHIIVGTTSTNPQELAIRR
jgi:hypothetical protein